MTKKYALNVSTNEIIDLSKYEAHNDFLGKAISFRADGNRYAFDIAKVLSDPEIILIKNPEEFIATDYVYAYKINDNDEALTRLNNAFSAFNRLIKLCEEYINLIGHDEFYNESGCGIDQTTVEEQTGVSPIISDDAYDMIVAGASYEELAAAFEESLSAFKNFYLEKESTVIGKWSDDETNEALCKTDKGAYFISYSLPEGHVTFNENHEEAWSPGINIVPISERRAHEWLEENSRERSRSRQVIIREL